MTASGKTTASSAEAAIGNISAAASELETSTLILQLTVSPDAAAPALTTSDGYTYAVTNGKLVPATSDHKWGKAVLGHAWFSSYTDAEDNEEAFPEAIAAVKAGQTVTFKITASNRARVAIVDKDAEVDEWSDLAFTFAAKNATVITATIEEGGNVSFNKDVYYSILGVDSNTDVDKETADAGLGLAAEAYNPTSQTLTPTDLNLVNP